jgi:hypothetical protein
MLGFSFIAPRFQSAFDFLNVQIKRITAPWTLKVFV